MAPPDLAVSSALPAGMGTVGAGLPAAHRFTQLCVEVIGGYRPIHQLRALTCPAAFESVAAQLARPGAAWGRQPRRPAQRVEQPVRQPPDRLRLRRVRTCQARTNAIEAAAVLSRGDRAWALAIRLERRDVAWLCTHLQVV
jgi:hypothetical protein